MAISLTAILDRIVIEHKCAALTYEQANGASRFLDRAPIAHMMNARAAGVDAIIAAAHSAPSDSIESAYRAMLARFAS